MLLLYKHNPSKYKMLFLNNDEGSSHICIEKGLDYPVWERNLWTDKSNFVCFLFHVSVFLFLFYE